MASEWVSARAMIRMPHDLVIISYILYLMPLVLLLTEAQEDEFQNDVPFQEWEH